MVLPEQWWLMIGPDGRRFAEPSRPRFNRNHMLMVHEITQLSVARTLGHELGIDVDNPELVYAILSAHDQDRELVMNSVLQSATGDILAPQVLRARMDRSPWWARETDTPRMARMVGARYPMSVRHGALMWVNESLREHINLLTCPPADRVSLREAWTLRNMRVCAQITSIPEPVLAWARDPYGAPW